MNIKGAINLSKLIDHTKLSPDATDADIVKLCEEAVTYGFFSVCVNPFFVGRAKALLSGTEVKVTTVIGFPLGMTLQNVKTYEAKRAVAAGADELDIVINIGAARSGHWAIVEKEISDVIAATPRVIHKIIIETCYLTDDEKKRASYTVLHSGAEFIKTSTGFGTAGATVRDIELIRSATEGRLAIKAAGGIRSLQKILELINAGATRIGTSSSVEILKEMGKGAIS